MALKDLLAAKITVNVVDSETFAVLTGITKSDAEIVAEIHHSLTAGATGYGWDGSYSNILAALYQDDDAHDACTLVACLNPLHPGPCKGWKHTLHAVSPGAWHQLEAERVRKANERRVKRIADLHAQGKPIPRRLLTEIKPKPAPGPHAPGSAPATPHGQLGQKAGAAGGQAHTAGQAISNAAGVTPNQAPALPLGPKGKKPSVSGRGPAFVITQPKVTDTYKLDKAAKITPQEWDALPPADKTAIRNELTAIKARGFGPQQSKADALLAKLPAASTVGNAPKLGAAGMDKATAFKLEGDMQAAKDRDAAIALISHLDIAQMQAMSDHLGRAHIPDGTTPDDARIKLAVAIRGRSPRRNVAPTVITPPKSSPRIGGTGRAPISSPGKVTLGQAIKTPAAPTHVTSATQADAALRITEAIHGPQNADPAKLAAALDKMKAAGDLKDHQNFKLLVNRLANNALKKASAANMPGLGHGSNDVGITEFNHEIRDHIAEGKPGLPPVVQRLKDALALKPSVGPHVGPTPQAPGAPNNTPKAFPPHVQHARAVAGRALGGRPTAKTHLETYEKLSKADFDSLDAPTQKTIRDDLANARAKFLDPKKKQEAADLLDRFGSSHPTPAAAVKTDTSVPHPKGYSDPMAQAVKAVHGGGAADDTLKAVGRLTPDQVGKLDAADRTAVLHRLAFVATHPKATPEQKDRATAYGRIINSGSPAATLKRDHEPSLAELHADEKKNPALHPAVGEALKAATETNAPNAASAPRAARIAALTALTKPQFDALAADDQRKITDALQSLHYTPSNHATGNLSSLDKSVGDAITTYTGQHPAMHHLQQAEADFRAGKSTGADVHRAYLRARVQAPPAADKNISAAVDTEAARIAKDNPGLPTYVRVAMAGDRDYTNKAYEAISMAGMQHNWEAAPRLSTGDLNSLFRPTEADFATVDPIHAQAVRDLQNHVLLTGLRGEPGVPTGSPWSIATRNAAVRALLTPDGDGEIPADRLALYKSLDQAAQDNVKRTLTKQLDTQTDLHAKTETWVGLRALQGKPPLDDTTREAVSQAAQKYGVPSEKADAYRKLDPFAYDNLPGFVRTAIQNDLAGMQRQAAAGGAVRTWTPQDNPLKVMPAALAAHLEGGRVPYSDRRLRNASDIANYGTGIINPHDRIRAYADVTSGPFKLLAPGDRQRITDDLDRIGSDNRLPLPIRYNARFTSDIALLQGNLNMQQGFAVAYANPAPASPLALSGILQAFNGLSKADYDGLDKVYRDAIDERVKLLPGSDQQLLTAKFHPQAAAANPSGMTPTSVQANVPPHVQAALDTIYGVHKSGKSHTMAHQLATYGALRGSDFHQLNGQEQGHLLGDLSFIATTAKGPSADKARKLIDRFTPAGTPSGHVPTGAVIPPANAVPGQVRYATPLKGLEKAKDSGKSGDGWISLPGGGRVWGAHGAAGLMLQHVDPQTGEKRYLMVQRGPAISDPGKWTFPGGAIDSKETPHQGAARETIEELGLKGDVLKDALVHGDHTFTVPGSTWKYTTVAAQVPTMIKPNLSTAHARAETSDAKWMTLAEIQALDKSGSLHHPIAGGKLEQNVISLYPTGTTLAQAVRPGPVTKRQGRLNLPPGGRQAPASFNAWPHPHKQSKGKDLIPDKAAFDAQRQKIKNDRKMYDGKTADGRLAAIGAQQGFDDTPTVVDKKEIDRLLATGDYIEAWRGVSGAGGAWSARSRGGSGGKTAADINEEMRTGPAYYGKGIFGNGYYLATQKRVAEQYSDHTHGSLVRILIPKTAITQKYDKVAKESHANPRSSKAKGAGYGEISTFYDPGRYAAAKGIDGIEIEPHHRSPGGGAGHVASHGKPAFNWLNRSVLIVQKEPG